MDIKKKIGNRIREIRLKKNMTQEQLSKHSGLDRTFVSHVENGSRNVSIETIDSLLRGMEVSYKYFFSTSIFH